VLSMNLHRRQLTKSQRSMVAGNIANLQNGQQQRHAPPIGGAAVTQAEAAALLNVGERSVQRARVVIERGTPELVKAVERGDVSVSSAVKIALPADATFP
jgi:hypothetical protein